MGGSRAAPTTLKSHSSAGADLEAAKFELFGGSVDGGRSPCEAREPADAPALGDHVLHVHADVEAAAGLFDFAERRGDGRHWLGHGGNADRLLLDREDGGTGENADIDLV